MAVIKSQFDSALIKSLKIAGGATTAALTCTGIEADDILLAADFFATRTNEMANQSVSLEDEAVLAAGTVTFGTTTTTGGYIRLVWIDVDGSS